MSAEVRIRPADADDLDWVVRRHGDVLAPELGFNDRFEAMIARIVTDYGNGRDPQRENAWIADVDGRRAGCVFCMASDESTAQLRVLYVEAHARGLGVGDQLVAECVRFAREADYRRLILWTLDILHPARRIYASTGFRLVEQKPHDEFAPNAVDELWDMSLRSTENEGDASVDR